MTELIDPFIEINKLRYEMDVAMVEGQKNQDFSRAFEIKRLLEQKTAEIKQMIDPWQLELRNQIAKEYKLDYVGLFNGQGIARALTQVNSEILNPDRWFLINKRGESVTFLYKHINPFSDKFWLTTDILGQKAYLNEFGQSAFADLQIFEGKVFSEGLAATVQYSDGLYKWQYINHQGEVSIKNISSFDVGKTPGNFSEDLAFVKNNWYNYIDKSGQRAIDADFTLANDFESGLALVHNNVEAFYINKSGARITKANIRFGTDFGKDRAYFLSSEGVVSAINKSGDIIQEIKVGTNTSKLEFINERLFVSSGNLFHLFDTNGNRIQLPRKFNHYEVFEGVIQLSRDNNRKYFDLYGKDIF